MTLRASLPLLTCRSMDSSLTQDVEAGDMRALSQRSDGRSSELMCRRLACGDCVRRIRKLAAASELIS
jgi:hypothetical protein